MKRLMLAAAALAALGLAVPAPAEAGSRQPTKLTVTKKPKRSFLDAGTTVFPGSQTYHDYIFVPNTTAFTGIDPSGQSRGPLPGPFDLPGMRPLTVDFRAPDALMR